MNRRQFATLAVATSLTALVSTLQAMAANRQLFSGDAFNAAQKKNARILVDISATWCPTCRAQEPIVNALMDEAGNQDVVIFDVDFDTQKDVVRYFNARMQSTLIAFRGPNEIGRSVGDTDPDSIANLVQSTR
ncbi:MAG: thioredoxin [Mesorhizobium sp.]|uniref:thioredoxin family protein n=1 Tax=Mesorhizobium sp. TaxID=1871066 RepID=UPI000FE8C7F4|nr:thioredoxin family protein [Mesorhizobium sp.]RWL84423.1 MAG: thioredoxin [Mesorhizobium sp.]RWL88098.1 MAG: thioredoxin [Mesorhizobium sp.]RWL94742.1 MAG: thioredoxin [Mesorhizobium sp.]